MCLICIGWWLALGVGVIVIDVLLGSNISSYAVLIAVPLGILGPIVISHWRPIFLRWPKRRQTLCADLLAKGILSAKEIQADLRFVHVCELEPQSLRRKRRGRRGDAFMWLEGRTLHLIAKDERLKSDQFALLPRKSGRCGRCWIIWACGGEGLYLRLRDADAERVFLVESREGRSLWECARNSEMLAEVVDIEAKAAEAPQAAENKA